MTDTEALFGAALRLSAAANLAEMQDFMGIAESLDTSAITLRMWAEATGGGVTRRGVAEVARVLLGEPQFAAISEPCG